MNLIKAIWQCVSNGGNAKNVVKSPSGSSHQPSSRTCVGKRSAESEIGKDYGYVQPKRALDGKASLAVDNDAYLMVPHRRNNSVTTSTVLIIDDEKSIRDLVSAQLSREGRQVLLASDGQEALEMFRRERPDLTILDLHMPGMTGMEVLRKIREIDSQAMVIIFTGSYSEESVREARALGVREFLEKGLSTVWTDRRRRL